MTPSVCATKRSLTIYISHLRIHHFLYRFILQLFFMRVDITET